MESVKDCINKTAVVVGLKRGQISVEMEVNEACGGCVAKGVCGNSGSEKRVLTVKNPSDESFKLGERVEVSIQRKTGYLAVLLSYILPFLVFFITLQVGLFLDLDELTSGLSSLGVLLIYFAILLLLHKKIDTRINFTITKTH